METEKPASEPVARPVVVTWTGKETPAAWAYACNWSGGITPAAGVEVKFGPTDAVQVTK